MGNADQNRLSNWGVVGVFASVVAYAILAWGVFFNWGTILDLPVLACALSFLAVLTSISFYLALGSERRITFTRLVSAVLLTWVLIGVIFGVAAVARYSPPLLESHPSPMRSPPHEE